MKGKSELHSACKIFHFCAKMPRSCAAYNCSNAANKPDCIQRKVSFHLFPSDIEIRRKWIAAVKRKHFEPGKFAYLCSDHFSTDDYIPNLSLKKLFPNAVPTVFTDLPEYMQPKRVRYSTAIEKRVVSQINESISAHVDQQDPSTSKEICTCDTSQLQNKVKELENAVKFLKVKLASARRRCRVKQIQKRRLRKRVESLDDLVTELMKRNLIDKDTLIDLKDRFSRDKSQLMSELLGHRPKSYSDEVKEFSCSLFFKSPSAYNYVRKFLQIPNPSTIR